MRTRSIRRMSFCCAFILFLLLGSFSNENAWAYYYLVRTGCNSGGTIPSRASNMALLNISFPNGSTWENAMISAMNEFNTDVPGSGWRFSWNKDSDNQFGGDNGVNEVAFATGAQIGHDAPAWTNWWYDYDWSWGGLCNFAEAIGEADVLFNLDYGWSSSVLATPNPTCDPLRPKSECVINLKGMALHELGHAAGLQHENRWLATMGQGSYAYFGLYRNLPMIHSDDKAGIRFLYGDGTTGTDVAVHAWKQTSTSGEYGAIGDITQSSSLTDASVPYAFMEYTLENHGTTTQDAAIGFYILQNGTWNLLGTTSFTGISPGYIGTFSRYLYIPLGVPNGSYNFKVVVDYNNALSETNESNNQFQLRSPITINMNRSAPVLSLIGNKTVNEGQLLTFTISATDADGGTLTYSASNLPLGATFSGGTFSWTPGFEQSGIYSVTFTARDPGGLSDSETITITTNNVDRAPVLNPIGNKTVKAGELLSFTVSASDPDGDALLYFVNANMSGFSFNNQVFNWTPTSAQTGSFNVTFTVNDPVGLSDSETIVITAELTNDIILSSQTISSGAVEHKALNSITAGPAFVVEGTAEVTFKAGTTVTLKPGFQAKTGSKFRAVPSLN